MVMGRPTKFTPEVCEAIIKEVKEGLPEKTACELVGIDRTTLFYWRKKAKAAKRRNKYTDFFNRLEGAKAFGAKKHLKAIMQSKDWKSRKYLLSLLDPELFNDVEKIKLEHSGELKQEVKADITHDIPDHLFDEVVRIAARIDKEKDKPA